VSAKPTKPEVFPYSFFLLKGDEGSPVCLLGPVHGDSVDHTLFWLPTERTIVTGDAVYARSTHAWVEEIETADILHAWYLTLNLIEALQPTKIIAGHIEEGWELDAKEDMAYMRKYLDLFSEKITNAPKKASVEELYETFKNAFPQCEKNLDFFLGHLSNQFGEGGKVWEENRYHDVGGRKREQLEGFLFGVGK
jgi:glyoxylase-like metal-dependent hydrolase (beta-lactamase superfamily II)